MDGPSTLLFPTFKDASAFGSLHNLNALVPLRIPPSLRSYFKPTCFVNNTGQTRNASISTMLYLTLHPPGGNYYSTFGSSASGDPAYYVCSLSILGVLIGFTLLWQQRSQSR